MLSPGLEMEFREAAGANAEARAVEAGSGFLLFGGRGARTVHPEVRRGTSDEGVRPDNWRKR
jgi:hypothetical protein